MERWQSWSIAPDLKSDELSKAPRVRIPPSPSLLTLKIMGQAFLAGLQEIQ